MTKFDTKNQDIVVLTDEEMMSINGGLAPVIGWIVANPVTAAKIAGGVAVYNYATGKW